MKTVTALDLSGLKNIVFFVVLVFGDGITKCLRIFLGTITFDLGIRLFNILDKDFNIQLFYHIFGVLRTKQTFEK